MEILIAHIWIQNIVKINFEFNLVHQRFFTGLLYQISIGDFSWDHRRFIEELNFSMTKKYIKFNSFHLHVSTGSYNNSILV